MDRFSIKDIQWLKGSIDFLKDHFPFMCGTNGSHKVPSPITAYFMTSGMPALMTYVIFLFLHEVYGQKDMNQ